MASDFSYEKYLAEQAEIAKIFEKSGMELEASVEYVYDMPEWVEEYQSNFPFQVLEMKKK